MPHSDIGIPHMIPVVTHQFHYGIGIRKKNQSANEQGNSYKRTDKRIGNILIAVEGFKNFIKSFHSILFVLDQRWSLEKGA